MKNSKELINEALYQTIPTYNKMLMINLTTDSFTPMIVADDEWNIIGGQHIDSIKQYWQWFTDSELIHPEDKDVLKEFVEIADAGKHICYRRLIDDKYKWVVMQIIPSVNYTPNNKECALYVKDIHDIYSKEYESVIDKIGTTDSMTGLYNKLGFTRDCAKIKCKNIGIMYADINGLKRTNDTKGHKAGDELIQRFANLLRINFRNYKSYHISGDEFIVVSFDHIREFLADTISFHKSMWTALDVPIASVGYSCGESSELNLILQESEKEMYDDKQLFYSKFPDYKR